MQSHPGQNADPVQRRAGRRDNRGWGISSFCGSRSEKPVLLGPVERQIEFGQTRRRKLDRLPALQDCLDQLWAQEGQTNKTPDVAPADAVAFGQLLQRSRATAGQLVEPRSSACNRLDQRRMVVLCVDQHKPGPRVEGFHKRNSRRVRPVNNRLVPATPSSMISKTLLI